MTTMSYAAHSACVLAFSNCFFFFFFLITCMLFGVVFMYV